ncbi:hypothetical protein IWX90DRAFT_277011 [Phyllosticta citrichinensis]|uniref:Uncharacterized protein n=1 Tax=Phyllosticta citrichinensis TaxID=1130410 RepID=A0ABR1XN74_9PEZI
MSAVDHNRPATPTSAHSRRRTSSIDFNRSPQSRRSSAAYSPVATRPSHGLHTATSYSELNGDADDSFTHNDGGELGNLADELADAEEDDYDEGETELVDGDASLNNHSDNQQQPGPPNGHVRELSRESAALLSPATVTMSPVKSLAGSKHRRNRSRYDGSDYGSESDLEASDGISAGLEARMAAIESLARRGTENNGSSTDGVMLRVTEQLRDLGTQAGVESAATRLITAHTALNSHLTHQTRILTSLTSSLCSPLAPLPSPETIDALLPLLADTISSVPNTPMKPLHQLTNLSNQTHDLLDSLSFLADSLHMGRQTSNLAQRRLKLVREAMGEWKRENELREEGIRWIERGNWDARLKERRVAVVCKDVVGGFEEICNGWRERLVAVGNEEVPAA